MVQAVCIPPFHDKFVLPLRGANCIAKNGMGKELNSSIFHCNRTGAAKSVSCEGFHTWELLRLVVRAIL